MNDLSNVWNVNNVKIFSNLLRGNGIKYCESLLQSGFRCGVLYYVLNRFNL